MADRPDTIHKHFAVTHNLSETSHRTRTFDFAKVGVGILKGKVCLLVWLPGEPPPSRVSADDFPVGLWQTWLLLTALYFVLSWLPFEKNPAPAIRMFTPITVGSFATVRVVFVLPFAFFAVYAGDLLGRKLNQRPYGYSTTGHFFLL